MLLYASLTKWLADKGQNHRGNAKTGQEQSRETARREHGSKNRGNPTKFLCTHLRGGVKLPAWVVNFTPRINS